MCDDDDAPREVSARKKPTQFLGKEYKLRKATRDPRFDATVNPDEHDPSGAKYEFLRELQEKEKIARDVRVRQIKQELRSRENPGEAETSSETSDDETSKERKMTRLELQFTSTQKLRHELQLLMTESAKQAGSQNRIKEQQRAARVKRDHIKEQLHEIGESAGKKKVNFLTRRALRQKVTEEKHHELPNPRSALKATEKKLKKQVRGTR